MFHANYGFSMTTKVVQVVSHAGCVRTHRTSPLGSNTLNALSRISTTKRDKLNVDFVRAVAFMPKVRRADWSFKQVEVRPVHKIIL